MDIFNEPSMSPFLISLYILTGLVAIEFALLMLGTDLFHFVDDLLPDLDHGVGDHDFGDLHSGEAPALGKALSFIGIGKVPVVMVLMSFLALFGLSGYLAQHSAKALSGDFIPLAAAVPAALVVSLLATGRVAALLARYLPGEETTAVRADSLIGGTARIKYGDARFTRPASATVEDRYGNVHHIQVKASDPEEVIFEGQQAKLVSRLNGFFIGTRIPDQNQ